MAQENKRLVARLKGEVLTTSQVAELLQLSVPTVKRRFEDGTIPARKFGSKWRCSRSAVDKLFDIA